MKSSSDNEWKGGGYNALHGWNYFKWKRIKKPEADFQVELKASLGYWGFRM